MDKKVILSADSTCDLTPEMRERFDVHVYPYHIILDGEDYIDNVTITPKEIFSIYEEKKVLPQTAAVNVYEYVEYFKQWTEKGYEVVHLNLGSALSVGHKNCLAAAAQLEGVYAIDSCNLSTGTGLLVLKAADLIAEGKSGAEIKEAIMAMTHRVSASFILDTLRFMHAGGRCSGVQAFSANMLNIKPCIVVDNKDGSMSVGKKYRGNLKKVLPKYAVETLKEHPNIDTSRIFITHSGISLNYVEQVRSAVLAQVPFKEVFVTQASCTISSHCGPNTLGILFMDAE